MAHEALEQIPGITQTTNSDQSPMIPQVLTPEKTDQLPSILDLFMLNHDVLACTLTLLTTKHLRLFASTSKRYRLLIHKHLFSASRHETEDSRYQTQLLKQWAHCPEYILNESANWEITLRKYFSQSQTLRLIVPMY